MLITYPEDPQHRRHLARAGNSTIVKADEQLSVETGILQAEIRDTIKDFSLSDAYVLATARNLDAKVLTGDPHFKDVKDAIMI